MKKGFTLVELLVVVAILGILAAVGIVSFGGFLGKSKIIAADHNYKMVRRFVWTGIQGCDAGIPIYLDYAGILRADDWCACAPPYEQWCKRWINDGGTDRLAERYTQHFRGKIKNPYNTNVDAVGTSCPGPTPGCIEIWAKTGTDDINFTFYNKNEEGSITHCTEKINLLNLEIATNGQC